MKLGYARVPAPKRYATCHIVEYGPAGIWRGALCGSRGINSHGGIATATCRRCLAIAFRRYAPTEFDAGVFKRAIRRARRLGVHV